MISPKYIVLALIFFVLALTSCHKDEPANPNSGTSSSTGGSTGNMALQFNGTLYSAVSITAVDSSGKLKIAGVVNNSTSIYLAAAGGFSVGSYTIASGSPASATFTGAGTTYDATSGTIAVTAVTGTTIAGTFNFITTNTAGDTTGTATNGTFQTTYITK